MSNMYGRQVVVPLTNKSGGGVVAGDVVIIDTANDTAFTTTASARSETTIGVAQETIASNAVGRVLIAGHAALVNVPASVTRGHYVETHTVAKQATGSATRRSGSIGQFLTGGTTPSAVLWGQSDQAASGGTGVTGARLTPSSDCSIDSQNATTNNDSSTTFAVGSDWSDTTFTRFGMMTFDTSSLAGMTVYRAVLRLTRTSSNIQAGNVTPGMAVEARRCLRAYNPTQVTWNQYSSGNNWTTAGAKSDGNDRAATVYGHGAEDRGPVTNEIAIDITGLVAESLAAAETTLRIMIGHNVPIGQDSVSFASIEHATAAYRPKMDVLYS